MMDHTQPPHDLQSEGLFKELLESIPDALIAVESTGRIVFVNRNAELLFGYERSELIGQQVEILIPSDIRGHHQQLRFARNDRSKRREMSSGIQFAGQKKDGTRFAADVALTVLQLHSANPPYTVAFVRDVTHLRRAEMAEREVLEQTLIGLVETLNRMLSFSSPLVYERTQSIRQIVSHLTAKGYQDAWEYRLAGALCLIGCVGVPIGLFEKVWSGAKLTDEERRIFRMHPLIGEQLIVAIPRLENVAAIIGKQHSPEIHGDNLISVGVQLLQIAQNSDRLLYQGHEPSAVVQLLKRQYPHYRYDALELLIDYEPPQLPSARKIPIRELKAGMVLDEDFCTKTGLLIALRGTRITAALMERIENFARSSPSEQGLRVKSGVPVPEPFSSDRK